MLHISEERGIPFEIGDPFLGEGGSYAHIYQLKSSPDYLVKDIKVRIGENGNSRSPKDFSEMRKEFESGLGEIKKHLSKFLPEFHLTYLVGVPNADSLDFSENTENRSKEANAYMVVKKVTKAEMEEGVKNLQIAKELDDFIEAAGGLYLESFGSDYKGLSVDLKSEHFIFGTTAGHPKPHLYFVDLYPRFKLGKNNFIQRINILTEPFIDIYKFPKTQKLVHSLNELES